jgi:ATP-binding cassette subfamily B protein
MLSPEEPGSSSSPAGTYRPRPGTGDEPRRGGLVFDRVGFGYEAGQPRLRDVSFRVAPGETVALVGYSGSGKSTITKLLLRLYEPQTGRILLDGVPIQELGLAELRDAVAMVPQDTALLHASVRENIALGYPDADAEALEAALRLAQLDRLVDDLPAGIDTLVGERGLRLSGGERQRVAMARAALRRPRVYVFDEATSSLDTRTERDILGRLRELADGTTTLVVAHRLSTIADADLILVLDQGNIVERGRHDELLQLDGLYAALWRAQHRIKRSLHVVQ